MTQITEEMLTAYADGEAAPDVRLVVERALERDQTLHDALAHYRALKGEIDRAYRPVLFEPVPTRLLVAAGVGSDAPMVRPRPSRWLMPAAMAASLVIGVSAGALMMQAPVQHEGGVLIAGIGAASALAALRDGESREGLRVIASYEGADGRFCRRFEVTEDGTLSDALACRSPQDHRWRLAALEPLAPEGAYMPAGESASGVGALISSMRLLAGDEVDTLLSRK